MILDRDMVCEIVLVIVVSVWNMVFMIKVMM